MTTKQIILSLLLILVVIALVLVLTSPQETEEQQPPADIPFGIEQVEAVHTIEDSLHTVSGVFPVPSACYELNTSAIVRESMPEQVTIEFTLTEVAEMCAQVIIETPFTVTFSASPEATIDATLNDEPIELILTGEEETPAL
jgi:hypothetical protein